MDIDNIKMIKDNLVNIKETNNQIKKSSEIKQGCIKVNDYFSF